MRQVKSSPLWPIRYRPFPDELLSCWLVRLARGHGLRVQTFCNLIFGNRHQVWNRDVDRLGPDWILNEIATRTGMPLSIAYSTTIRTYEGWLYPKSKGSGTLQWIQTLKLYHRKRQGFGLQFCAQCLREGPEPYFRKSWRVTFITICVQHQCMLRDRCPKCGAGVVFHRRDMGYLDAAVTNSLAGCHRCEFDLARSAPEPIIGYDKPASDWHSGLCRQLTGRDSGNPRFGLDLFNVMRKFSMLLTSPYSTVRLHEHVCDQMGVPTMPLSKGRIAIETRPLHERHHLMQLIAWLMVDLEPRLRVAWQAKAVRYNHLLKGFDDAPSWYCDLVEGFSDWRRG